MQQSLLCLRDGSPSAFFMCLPPSVRQGAPKPTSSVPLNRESVRPHRSDRSRPARTTAHFNFRFRSFSRGIRETFGPLERFFPRLPLDERVAGDELLRLGERPVDHGALSSCVLDAPALRGWL